MRKFRLIKEYPGSPKLNTEVETDGNKILYKGVHSTLLIKEVTNFSEFWQEVIEKEYEILSIKGFLREIKKSDFINDGWIQFLNNNKDSEIHSVKRLSDGEIFTIGDEVKHRNVCNKLDSCNILDIYIAGNKLLITTANFNTNICMLDKITKKPLFTTEDGVDIFKNDICWVVNSNNYALYKWTNPINTVIIDDEKYFSTIEAAKDYILMNKPCLSINDLMKAASITYCNLTGLKELVKVKSKL
jgi:hypothetical protein